MGINFRSVKGFYVVVSHNGVPEKQTKKKKLKNVMSRRNLKMLLSSSVHCDFTSLLWHGLIKHFLPSYWKINGHVHRCKWKKCVMYVCKWEKKVFLFILTLLLETLLTADTPVQLWCNHRSLLSVPGRMLWKKKKWKQLAPRLAHKKGKCLALECQ